MSLATLNPVQIRRHAHQSNPQDPEVCRVDVDAELWAGVLAINARLGCIPNAASDWLERCDEGGWQWR